jgi:hypothetical protein
MAHVEACLRLAAHSGSLVSAVEGAVDPQLSGRSVHNLADR